MSISHQFFQIMVKLVCKGEGMRKNFLRGLFPWCILNQCNIRITSAHQRSCNPVVLKAMQPSVRMVSPLYGQEGDGAGLCSIQCTLYIVPSSGLWASNTQTHKYKYDNEEMFQELKMVPHPFLIENGSASLCSQSPPLLKLQIHNTQIQK